MFSKSLKEALSSTVLHAELHEVMNYSVFPAGKLFRPRLVEALALDLTGHFDRPHLHLAHSLELHHAYTLVHDDLPSMDNDLIRRGRPSTHAQYGEWKAVLTGDALLISSFEELMKMKHERAVEVHHLFTWATGAKGLILGQFLDLSAQGKLNFNEIVRIHELKTGRLIQVATLGAYLLSDKTPTLRKKMEFLRLGREIGVSFQLLDDLNELTVEAISSHEKEINPFLLSSENALKELKNSVLRIKTLLFKHQLNHVQKMLTDYFKKNQQDLLQNIDQLEQNLKDQKILPELRPWITTFV